VRSRRPLLRVFALLGMTAILAWTLYPALRVHYQETREKTRLETELEVLKERNEILSAQVDRLKTPEGVEEIARESLGMVKEGENLYVVLEEGESTATAPPRPVSDEQERDPAWIEVLDLVFGVR